MIQQQFPSGLQALLGRQQPRQKATIPPGLNALMQAQEVLRQQANPTTPEGTPTVAGQTEQAIQQQMQPQPQMQPQMQPQGMPGMMPTDPFREQLMKTLQMQAQQQMQGQPQQPPQQPPQGMASGGIAALPADNMARIENYAYGGVIGFSGQGPSAVSQAQDIEQLGSQLDVVKENLRALKAPGVIAMASDPTAAEAYASKRSELKQQYDELNEKYQQALKTAGLDRPAQGRIGGRDLMLRPSANPVLQELYKETPKTWAPGPGRAPTSDIYESLGPGESSGAVASAASRVDQARPTPSRVASVRPASSSVTAAQPQIAMSPEMASDFAKAREMRDAPLTEERPDLAKMRAQDEAERAAQGLKGLVGARTEEAIKAAEARDLALRAKYEKGLEGRGLENLITALSAGARGTVGSLGGAYARTAQEQRVADLQFEQLMNASAAKRDEMAAAVDAMREAKATGNVKAYRDAEQSYIKNKADNTNIQRQLAGVMVQSSTQLTEGAMERASKEKIERMRMQVAMMKPSDQQRIDELAKLHLARITGGTAPTTEQRIEALTSAMQDVKGAGQAGGRDIRMQQLANKELEDYKKSVEYINVMGKPEAATLLQRKQQELMHQYPGAVFGTSPVMPKPGEVRSGFKFKGGDPGDRNNWEKV